MTELTYPKEKMEVIVIDDASTDRTGEKAEKFAKEHEFIMVVHRGPEEGGKGKPDVLNCGYLTFKITFYLKTGEFLFSVHL